jgi:hypothetical protein
VHIIVIASSTKVLPAFIPGCPFAIQDVSGGAQTPFGSHYAGFELVMDKKCA